MPPSTSPSVVKTFSLKDSVLAYLELSCLVCADGIEGDFSRIVGVTYPQISEMIVGQSWQLLELVYSQEYSRRLLKQVIVTGNEAVSRKCSGLAC